MSSRRGKGSKKRAKKAKAHSRAKFRQTAASLKFFADTDHTGTVKVSERKWKYRKKAPGAIIVFNCDRDGATSPKLDFEDEDIVNASELKDLSKLVVKRNEKIPAGYYAFLTLSVDHAKKVRIFDKFRAGARVALGNVAGTPVTEYPMKHIRKRDYTFAVEALKPVTKPGEETVEIHVQIRKGKKKKFDDYVLFTIAPWLMLSNIEEVDTAYVANTVDNTAFTWKLRAILGSRLQGLPPFSGAAGSVEVWVQDLMEIGFSSLPSTRSNPMHQFINSANSEARPGRRNLYKEIKKGTIASNFGHILVSQDGFKSLDSFGNLEVTPPFKKYPFGRIFYGYPSPAYSTGHIGQGLSNEVSQILKANKYQPAVKIPTNWLLVGHVDEFLSFVPDLKAGGKKFKLLQASPKQAIRLCRKLKKAGGGGAKICEGKAGYQITVNDFLKKGSQLLKTNNAIDNILSKIRRGIIRKEFDLPYIKGKDDIIGIPVIFNGTRLPGGKVKNAIARTAGMVNCLVVKPYAIVPKPFGPKNSAGKDIFEEYAKKKLQALGLQFRPVDDWDNYHVAQGEIHCGSNAKRVAPSSWKWWDRKLKIG